MSPCNGIPLKIRFQLVPFLFCEYMVISCKTYIIFSNNKPWISKQLKDALNQKKLSYYEGENIEKREAHKLVKIQLAKTKYTRKVDGELYKGHSSLAWKGIKSVFGMQNQDRRVFYPEKPNAELEEDLNNFLLQV